MRSAFCVNDMGTTLSAMQTHCQKCVWTGFEYIFSLLAQFLRDFSIAIVIAALVAKMIEVPNLINFVNGRTIESLSDYRCGILTSDQIIFLYLSN
jgi:hypothetical protein